MVRGQDGSGWGVYGQYFDAAGEAVGSEFLSQSNHRLVPQLAEPEQGATPTVAVLPSGHVVAVWYGDPGFRAKKIYARIFSGVVGVPEELQS